MLIKVHGPVSERDLGFLHSRNSSVEADVALSQLLCVGCHVSLESLTYNILVKSFIQLR